MNMRSARLALRIFIMAALPTGTEWLYKAIRDLDVDEVRRNLDAQTEFSWAGVHESYSTVYLNAFYCPNPNTFPTEATQNRALAVFALLGERGLTGGYLPPIARWGTTDMMRCILDPDCPARLRERGERSMPFRPPLRKELGEALDEVMLLLFFRESDTSSSPPPYEPSFDHREKVRILHSFGASVRPALINTLRTVESNTFRQHRLYAERPDLEFFEFLNEFEDVVDIVMAIPDIPFTYGAALAAQRARRDAVAAEVVAVLNGHSDVAEMVGDYLADRGRTPM